MIKEKLQQGWRWIKETSVKLWKIITAVAIGGAVLTASLLIPSEYPSLIMGDKIIEFIHTDNNTNEDLIIHTNRETYTGITKANVYVAVENKSNKGQIVNLQLFFSEGNRFITEVFKVEENLLNIPNDVGISTSTEPTIPELIWKQKILFDYSDIENQLLLNKSKFSEKDKRGFEAKKKVGIFIDKGDTAYFKMIIEFPSHIEDEFFIEAIGSEGGYGHLDPGINSTYMGEEFDDFNDWTESNKDGGDCSISPASWLYMDVRGATSDLAYARLLRWEEDLGLGTNDYYAEIKFQAHKWDVYQPVNNYVGIVIQLMGTHDNRLFVTIGNNADDGDGIFVFNDVSGKAVKLFTKTWAIDTNYIIRFYVHNSATDVDIWVDGVREVTDGNMVDAYATHNTLSFGGYGTQAGNGEYYTDYFYIGSELIVERRIMIIE